MTENVSVYLSKSSLMLTNSYFTDLPGNHDILLLGNEGKNGYTHFRSQHSTLLSLPLLLCPL